MKIEELSEIDQKEVQDLIDSGEWTQEDLMEIPNPALHVWTRREFYWNEKSVTVTRNYEPPFGDPDFGTFTENIEIQ